MLDSRTLVVEYKSKDYATNDDYKEKKLFGKVWAKGSNGRALFLMALKGMSGAGTLTNKSGAQLKVGERLAAEHCRQRTISMLLRLS